MESRERTGEGKRVVVPFRPMSDTLVSTEVLPSLNRPTVPGPTDSETLERGRGSVRGRGTITEVRQWKSSTGNPVSLSLKSTIKIHSSRTRGSASVPKVVVRLRRGRLGTDREEVPGPLFVDEGGNVSVGGA